jgi:hypothetical protein
MRSPEVASPEVTSPEMTSPDVVNRKPEMKGKSFPELFLTRISGVFPELIYILVTNNGIVNPTCIGSL